MALPDKLPSMEYAAIHKRALKQEAASASPVNLRPRTVLKCVTSSKTQHKTSCALTVLPATASGPLLAVFTSTLRILSSIFSGSPWVLPAALPSFSWSMVPSSSPPRPVIPKNLKRVKRLLPAPLLACSLSFSPSLFLTLSACKSLISPDYKMKYKILISLLLATLIEIYLPKTAFAQPIDPSRPGTPDMTRISDNLSVLNNAIGENSKLNSLTSPGLILSALLPYLLTLAGLILFGMLIWGGFTMLTAATDPKKAEAGKQRITTAVVGFIIIFTAYWLMQIVEIIFGIKVL